MKLQTVHDGSVYVTEGRTVSRGWPETGFEPVGSLPVAGDGIAAFGDRFKTTYPWKGLVESVVGSYQTTNLWSVSGGSLLATAGRQVLVSTDHGRTWTESLSLPASSGGMGLLPSSVCTHDGAVYLAEYPLDEDASPRLQRSPDDGRSWKPVLELPDVRHFHSVAVDPYEGDLWLTTGDRDDECRILRIRDGRAEVVGCGSQRWRAVELAFTRDAVLWGMDSAYAEPTRLIELPRSELETPSPTPEALATVDAPVYYAETLDCGGTEHVVVSTAIEAVVDRTAPPDYELDRDVEANVLIASADSGFREWRTVAAYGRRRTLADRTGRPAGVPVANAYVLLAATPDAGLLVNPFNTEADDGAVQRIPPSSLERLARGPASEVR